MAQGSRYPRYPEILRQAGVEGSVLVSFDVTEAGMADVASLKILETTHDLFAVAVREALPGMRFTPTADGATLTAQRVEQPFTFMIVGNEVVEREVPSRSRPGALADVVVSGITSSRVREPKDRPNDAPTVVLRGERSREMGEPPSIVIKSIAGDELRAVRGSDQKVKSAFGEIDPQDIEAIEVYKPSVCPASASVPCPLIVITVKRGREAAYRQR
jgi:TonB family protein